MAALESEADYYPVWMMSWQLGNFWCLLRRKLTWMGWNRHLRIPNKPNLRFHKWHISWQARHCCSKTQWTVPFHCGLSTFQRTFSITPQDVGVCVSTPVVPRHFARMINANLRERRRLSWVEIEIFQIRNSIHFNMKSVKSLFADILNHIIMRLFTRRNAKRWTKNANFDEK